MSKKRELVIHRAAVVAEHAVNRPKSWRGREGQKVPPPPKRGLSLRTIRRRLRRWLFALDHRARGKALRALRTATSKQDVEALVVRAVTD